MTWIDLLLMILQEKWHSASFHEQCSGVITNCVYQLQMKMQK
jgi:hypothetical protein